ncbi:DUF927 domain-containing protein [Thiocapsa roseopersicina]|uniref:DUF927 domain-containing protein n=1 Tax=Thiocapsa roseopersicina TaxID=1058 RepID=UPI0015875954|nr:DUF927 domain-containing protein [Thiocapsa roseopersicina]
MPTPSELKRLIDAAEFYRRELPAGTPLRAGRDGWTKNVPCPFPHHDDATGSFGVNLTTGAYRCFGCGENGGSTFDYKMNRYGLDMDGTRAELADQWGIEPGRTPATTRPSRPAAAPEAPRPAPAPAVAIPTEALASRPQAHPKHGAPSATWEYRDAGGRPLCYVLRFDPAKGRKLFAPLTWTPAAGWQWKAPAEPRPLYGLDRLAAHPEAPALLTEGEKAAVASAALFPAAVPIATMNGAQSPNKADWSPLAGRSVLIWPDHDDPGTKYAQAAARLALAAGARSVGILDLAGMATDPATGEPRELPQGWDAANASADGWTVETIAAAARWQPFAIEAAEAPVPTPQARNREPETPADDVLPFGFERRPGGIYFIKSGGPKGGRKGGDKPLSGTGGDDGTPVYICPPMRVLAITRDDRGESFGRLIAFRDLDGLERQEAIEDKERQGSGDALRARLAGLGFEVSTHPEARRLFLELFRRCTPPKRARTTSRTGWTPDGAAFVLPDRVLGGGPEPVILTVEGERPAFGTRGTLDDWRGTIGRWCVGNSRLTFAVAVSFAAPLLKMVDAESGIFHFRGMSTDASSSGKTTIQRAAASVYGSRDYLQRWRTTDNALEALAELHNDACLILDELNQIEPQAAGESAYLLGNGAGKNRLDRTASGRPIKRWRLLCLSSGEIGLVEHMASIQKKTRAGQSVRMVEIPADAGAGFGCFENLHEFSDGAAFSVALCDSAAAAYGTPLIAHVENLLANRAALPAAIARHRDAFVLRVLETIENPPGQVRRVAARFGLVAVGGELATQAGITGWVPGAAAEAAARCFRDWLDARGGAVPAEERDLLGQVRLFFEQHSNRFRWKSRLLDDHAPEIPRAVGFKDGGSGGLVFYLMPETFRTEVVEGYDPVDAARVLIRHKMLKPGADGRSTQKLRFPGFRGTVRVYVFELDTPNQDAAEVPADARS